MKIIWEADDIKPGVRARKPGCNEVWMVGYDPSIPFYPASFVANFTIVSLSDGLMTHKDMRKEQVAAILTDGGLQPVAWVGEVGE